MRRSLYIAVIALLFTVAAQGQRKYIYQDSTLLQEPVVELDTTTTEEVTVTPAGESEDEEYIEEAEPYIDTSLYFQGRASSSDSISNWAKMKGFEYLPSMDSLLKAKRSKVEKEPPPKESTIVSIMSSQAFQVLMWAVAVLFILFILYKLILSEGVFRKRTKSLKPQEEEQAAEPEITGLTDIEARLQKALEAGNYRLAVRYHYLHALHQLSELGKLELAPDKTNFQYVRELKDYNLQQAFASLTLNYEYVWYGEFDINKDIYDKIAASFKTFNKKN